MVGPAAYCPRSGDVVWLTLNPGAGHEQAGRRPAVALSLESYNRKTGLALFCPVTGQVKGYPFEVLMPQGLPVAGAILADQVKSLDWRAREAEFICDLPHEAMEEVLEKLGTLIPVGE